jgi:HNH endonuclease
MAISSQALSDMREGSETISRESRQEALPKRLAPAWGEDIVQSAAKVAAVREVLEAGFSKVDDSCWLWTGGTSHGYGQLRVHSVWGSYPIYAHRASYLLASGPIPEGMEVCHRCDTPLCVNPEHFFLGTQGDNVADMVSKKRHGIGAANGMAKLSDADVVRIREMAAGGHHQGQLAVLFRLREGQISRIIHGTRRADAGGPIRTRHGNFRHGRYAASVGE